MSGGRRKIGRNLWEFIKQKTGIFIVNNEEKCGKYRVQILSGAAARTGYFKKQ